MRRIGTSSLNLCDIQQDLYITPRDLCVTPRDLSITQRDLCGTPRDLNAIR